MTAVSPPRARAPRLTTPEVTFLPDGAVACASCGVAVARRDRAREQQVTLWAPRSLSRSGPPTPTAVVTLGRCDDCADRLRRAEALVALHGLGRVFGNVAGSRLDAALAALELLRLVGDASNPLTRTTGSIRGLMDHETGPGSAASFATFVASGGDGTTCATRPWSHVPPNVREAATDAYKVLVHQLAEVPGPVRPPGGEAGCLLCGVGAVDAPPSRAAAAWGDLLRVDIRGLGSTKYGTTTGYLCPRCRHDVGWRPLSLPTIRRLIVMAAGFEIRSDDVELDIPDAKAWVALRAGSRPNEIPWAHLDMASIPRRLSLLVRQGVVRRVGDEWPGVVAGRIR